MVVNQDASDDDDSGSSMGLNWKLILVFILIAGFCYISFQDDRLCSEQRGMCYYTWIVYTAFMDGGIFMAQMSWIWMKYKSAQFVGNNVHGSITYKPPVSAGDFYLLRLGGVSALNVEGSEGTTIFPKEAYNPLGAQVAAPCRFEKRTLSQLPLAVQDKILESNFPKPFLYGDINEEDFHIDTAVKDSPLNDEELRKIQEMTGGMGSLKRMNPAMLHYYFKQECELNSKYAKERPQLLKDAESMVAFGVRLHDKARHTGRVRKLIGESRSEEVDRERG